MKGVFKMTSNIYQKHLTISKRNLIEQGLNERKNFSEIAELISKSDRTVSHEIKKHRIFVEGNRYGFTDPSKKNCELLFKPSYVCNGCPHRMGCRKNKYYYYASDSQKNYESLLIQSRKGIDLTCEEFHNLNNIVSKEIKQGHSFSMICNNHKDEFNKTKRTLYNYIENGYLDIINLDLPRKVRYKKRRNHQQVQIRSTKIRENRTYQDFLKYKEEFYIKNHCEPEIVQMDTVEGIKGESILLTLLFARSNFLLAFKMDNKTEDSVTKVFDYLKENLGYKTFYEIFNIILTDNGSEFTNPNFIEDNGKDIEKTKIFYCDPRASQQKGSIEVTHQYIRRYVPKGYSFNQYSQEDITLMINHINSVPRDKFKGKTPFEIQTFFIDDKFIKLLDLKPIEKTKVILKPYLIKKSNVNI